MPATSPQYNTGAKPRNLRARHVVGAVAGNITVPGIKTTDELIYVGGLILVEGAPNTVTPTGDLTAEFTISAANTINNVGGTSSAAGFLTVLFNTRDKGAG